MKFTAKKFVSLACAAVLAATALPALPASADPPFVGFVTLADAAAGFALAFDLGRVWGGPDRLIITIVVNGTDPVSLKTSMDWVPEYTTPPPWVTRQCEPEAPQLTSTVQGRGDGRSKFRLEVRQTSGQKFKGTLKVTGDESLRSRGFRVKAVAPPPCLSSRQPITAVYASERFADGYHVPTLSAYADGTQLAAFVIPDERPDGLIFRVDSGPITDPKHIAVLHLEHIVPTLKGDPHPDPPRLVPMPGVKVVKGERYTDSIPFWGKSPIAAGSTHFWLFGQPGQIVKGDMVLHSATDDTVPGAKVAVTLFEADPDDPRISELFRRTSEREDVHPDTDAQDHLTIRTFLTAPPLSPETNQFNLVDIHFNTDALLQAMLRLAPLDQFHNPTWGAGSAKPQIWWGEHKLRF